MSNSVPKPRCANNPLILDEGRLKLAIERRDKAIAERNRLILEPNNGKEFIRYVSYFYHGIKDLVYKYVYRRQTFNKANVKSDNF